MICEHTLAEYSLRAYDEPSLRVENSAAIVDEVEGFTVVAVAGTNDFKDAWADVKALPWKPKELGVWVHAGFWFHAKKLIKPVMAQIHMNGRPVVFTGHSLGGQAAGMLAALCVLYGLEVANWTTFGCPKGGFSGYNKLTQGIAGRRFVRDGDQVANIPAILGWEHDRTATKLIGACGIIDHPMQGYLDLL